MVRLKVYLCNLLIIDFAISITYGAIKSQKIRMRLKQTLYFNSLWCD